MFNRVDESHDAPYDFDSVMHFGPKCAAKDKMRDTLVVKDRNARIGQREKLSPMDIERIRILYKDLKPVSRSDWGNIHYIFC